MTKTVKGWYFTNVNFFQNSLPPILHIRIPVHHTMGTVKVHGVLPSSRWYSASSRRIQFHGAHAGDSGAVVTPFMRVGTYPTRNFATLGQLELLPPFTGT